MVYAINVGSRVHHWNHAQVNRNLQFLANYSVYRYPTKKMGLLSHIFRAIALPFYSIGFYYTFGNSHRAAKVLVQIRPLIASDYNMVMLFNRLAPYYHVNCLDLPSAPVYTAPSYIPPAVMPVPAPVVHVPSPTVHIPSPVVYTAPLPQPRRSFFTRLFPTVTPGGRQIPGTGAVDLSSRSHVIPAPQPLTTRHITMAPTTPVAIRPVPQPAPMRQIPGTEVLTHARPANAMRTLGPAPVATPSVSSFKPMQSSSLDMTRTRVAVGGRR